MCALRRLTSLALALFAAAAALIVAPPRAARADERLLFCNTPERLRAPGAYADARLKKGKTYRIFFHYRNDTRKAGPLVMAFQDEKKRPVSLALRAGIGQPHIDPTLVGRQAMARYLSAPKKKVVGTKGVARFPVYLAPREVASGVVSVVADRDVRLRIYFRGNGRTVPGAKVVAIDAPRREVTVALTKKVKKQYRRIGLPEPGTDTVYGLLYAFRVDAPQGSRVRIAFSPRGGQAGLVGMLNGRLRQTPIVGAGWARFADAVVGKNGTLRLTTAPFGGVFYPVELVFELLP